MTHGESRGHCRLGPRDFYLRYGFGETGKMDADGEEVMIAYPL